MNFKKIFETAKFGDKFLTKGGKEAVFLRLADNAEYEFALLYVNDWGIVQVFRETGECIEHFADTDILHPLKDKPKRKPDMSGLIFHDYLKDCWVFTGDEIPTEKCINPDYINVDIFITSKKYD